MGKKNIVQECKQLANHSICFSMLLLQDVTSLTNYFQTTCGIVTEEKQLSVSGRNWGEVDLSGQ